MTRKLAQKGRKIELWSTTYSYKANPNCYAEPTANWN